MMPHFALKIVNIKSAALSCSAWSPVYYFSLEIAGNDLTKKVPPQFLAKRAILLGKHYKKHVNTVCEFSLQQLNIIHFNGYN